MTDDRPSKEFQKLHTRVRELETEYAPAGGNLHLHALARADSELYAALVELAREGLLRVHAHRAWFLQESLYADGHFWYDLCLLAAAAAARVHHEKAQQLIPLPLVNALTETLIEVSEYAVGTGDMWKRTYEALTNTLWAFPSDDLVKLARRKARTISEPAVAQLVKHAIEGLGP